MEDKNEDKNKKKSSAKNILNKTTKGISRTTQNLVKKAKNVVVKTIDQNGDHTLNKEDLSIFKKRIDTSTHKTTENIKSTLDRRKRDNDLRKLKPLFIADLDDAKFTLPKLICVSNPEKNFLESVACKGAIGRYVDYKNMNVITIFKDYYANFNIELYPDIDSTVYYVDPANKSRYIAMGEYFEYLKQARVNELEKIAQDLGAKHFKVTLMEERKSFVKKGQNKQAGGILDDVKVDANQKAEIEKGKVSVIEISSESYFNGHAPTEPKLRYLKNEPDIKTLIDLRMSSNSINNRKVIIKLSKTLGMRQNDAVNIDGALKFMHITGNTTIANEYSDESRKFFQYEIDF